MIPVVFQVREIDLTAVLGERLRIGCFVGVSQVLEVERCVNWLMKQDEKDEEGQELEGQRTDCSG